MARRTSNVTKRDEVEQTTRSLPKWDEVAAYRTKRGKISPFTQGKSQGRISDPLYVMDNQQAKAECGNIARQTDAAPFWGKSQHSQAE